MRFSKAAIRFAKYAGVGVSTFVFDLAMLYALVHFAGITYLIATPCAFLFAVSCNYAVSRTLVFRGTDRGWNEGYAYFILIALLGAGVTTGLVATLVSLLGVYYLVARVLVAGVVGMGNYIANLYFNFSVAGRH